MENFGIMGSQFPPGFRFHPTDQELIIHYLNKKVKSSLTPATSIIADIDLYKFDPWDLPLKAFFGEGEWFFFSPRDRKYPNGTRPNRATASGYWKATGIDKPILDSRGSKCLGVKKALVFYKGRPPKGIKTDWIMHEYRLLDDNKSSSLSQKHNGSMRLDDWVLCRVRQKGRVPTETGASTNSSAIQISEEQEALEELPNSLHKCSDNQLLDYLTSFQEDGGASTSGSSSSFECGQAADLAKPLQQFNSVLNSIKRQLSFGALDEFMLLPPNKRIHYSHKVREQYSSPTSSFSVDQAFPEFIIQ